MSCPAIQNKTGKETPVSTTMNSRTAWMPWECGAFPADGIERGRKQAKKAMPIKDWVRMLSWSAARWDSIM